MNNPESPGLIDIHSHFLPGLDDGPETLDQCIETARKYAESGYTRIIATPHYIQGTKWASSTEQVRETICAVEGALQTAGIHLQIQAGMEITLTDFLCKNFSPDGLLSLAGTQYFLVECSLGATVNDPAIQGLRNLLDLDDCRFILAHPERYYLFQEEPAQLHDLVNRGLLTQVNIGSIIGLAGKKTQQSAIDFFRAGMVHFLATDAHAGSNRTPPDTNQMSLLSALLGEETLRAALHENPLRMLQGKTIRALRHDEVLEDKNNVFIAEYGLAGRFKRLFRRN